MASSRANLSKKAKLIGIGAAIGLVIGAFSVFMLFTYNPPDKQEEPNVDVAVLMSADQRAGYRIADLHRRREGREQQQAVRYHRHSLLGELLHSYLHGRVEGGRESG